jgi:iron complex outermembrane receptor protein
MTRGSFHALAVGLMLSAIHAAAVAQARVELDPVEVRAAPIADEPPVEPTRPGTRLDGAALRERKGATLGDTVGSEMGIANSTFGPGVGLPVIRGLGGSRVRILTNGGAAHDASWISPDHATSADPMLADEVRVLRGPATIRYGGGAIGGAVEILDGRIPSRRPQAPLAGAAEGRYGTNGTEASAAARLEGGSGPIGFHAGAFARSRGNISIPGCAIDGAAVQRQFGLVNVFNTCGYVANSDARSAGGSAGASAFFDNGFVGGAFTGLKSDYGIPPTPASHGGLDDRVRINLRNRRYDARAELWGDGRWIDRVRLDVAHVNYRHDELQNGQTATTFRNDANDARLEVEHLLGERISGLIGGQILHRDFSALGDEAFVPPTTLRADALYLVERLSLGQFQLEAGWRREWQDVVAAPQRTVDRRLLVFPPRSFDVDSYSVAASWAFDRNVRASAILSRAMRAPEVQELYSFGPHLATATFDVGTSTLKAEAIRSTDLTFDADTDRWRAAAALFRSTGSNFIYQRTIPNLFYDTEERRFRARCVRLEQCLPVTQYVQSDARFHGYEVDVGVRFFVERVGRMELGVFSDYVRGELTQLGQDVPRLPPRRYGAQLAKLGGKWTARLRFTRAEAQDRPGVGETPTPGYKLLDFYASYELPRGGGDAPVLFLTARNLLDEQIRNSTSFLRHYAPEPGRSVTIGLVARF